MFDRIVKTVLVRTLWTAFLLIALFVMHAVMYGFIRVETKYTAMEQVGESEAAVQMMSSKAGLMQLIDIVFVALGLLVFYAVWRTPVKEWCLQATGKDVPVQSSQTRVNKGASN